MTIPFIALIAACGLCVLGAAFCAIVPRATLRPLFIVWVAVETGLALVAGGSLLGAPGPVARLPLWELPSLGRPILALDPISGLFLVVTALVFLITVPYAARHGDGYAGHARSGLFAALYQLLFAAILLVLAAGDVLSFLVSWETMSLLLYGLVVFDHDGASSQRPSFLMLAMGEVGIDRKSTRLNSSHTDIARMPSSA